MFHLFLVIAIVVGREMVLDEETLRRTEEGIRPSLGGPTDERRKSSVMGGGGGGKHLPEAPHSNRLPMMEIHQTQQQQQQQQLLLPQQQQQQQQGKNQRPPPRLLHPYVKESKKP